MRNNIDLSPSRYKVSKTSGSNKFVSSFSSKEIYGGKVEKASSDYWNGYIIALKFTVIIGVLTAILFMYFSL